MDEGSVRLERRRHQPTLLSNQMHKAHHFSEVAEQFADLSKVELASLDWLPER